MHSSLVDLQRQLSHPDSFSCLYTSYPVAPATAAGLKGTTDADYELKGTFRDGSSLKDYGH